MKSIRKSINKLNLPQFARAVGVRHEILYKRPNRRKQQKLLALIDLLMRGIYKHFANSLRAVVCGPHLYFI